MVIIVADDSTLSRKSVIKSIPESIKEYATILEASNGLEALELYKSNSVDVVFLDLTMPIMSGYEALEEIMKYDPNAVIVVISADIQSQAVEKTKTLGAKDFVNKPIDETKMKMIFLEVIKREKI
jgi:YesN/AraC family two-component response regulator